MTGPGTATVDEGTAGTPTTALGPDSNQVTVNLTGVTDAQQVAITLNGVQRSDGVVNNLGARMGVLLGDTDGDGVVNSGDTQRTRNNSGEITDSDNFRTDVNLDGTVNSGDAIIVRSRSGTGLP